MIDISKIRFTDSVVIFLCTETDFLDHRFVFGTSVLVVPSLECPISRTQTQITHSVCVCRDCIWATNKQTHYAISSFRTDRLSGTSPNKVDVTGFDLETPVRVCIYRKILFSRFISIALSLLQVASRLNICHHA